MQHFSFLTRTMSITEQLAAAFPGSGELKKQSINCQKKHFYIWLIFCKNKEKWAPHPQVDESLGTRSSWWNPHAARRPSLLQDNFNFFNLKHFRQILVFVKVKEFFSTIIILCIFPGKIWWFLTFTRQRVHERLAQHVPVRLGGETWKNRYFA